MANIEQISSVPKKRGVQRVKRHNLKTDMTPMVDLGFLLIAFFVMTTELSKPRITKLTMPTEKPGPSTTLGESNALSVLLYGDSILYYEGKFEKQKGFQFAADGLPGIAKIIRNKQLALDQLPGGRKELMVLIKSGDKTRYRTFIDMLDELLIHGVEKYAVVDQTTEELESLRKQ